MEDISRIVEFAESTECIVAQESTSRSYNRRSSILKPQKPRNPLQDLDFNPTLADETTVTRKSRRVSFAAGSQVKEFHEVRTEVANVTVWGPSYEQTIINSGSDSSHQVDYTVQGDSSNISNFDALVTGRIHISQHNHREGSENTPVDLRNNRGPTLVRHNVGQQGNNRNAVGNGAPFEDRPLDLTLGTARPPASKQSLRGANQNSQEDSRCEPQISNGSMFHREYSHHSIKTTFYGGDDEMDLSLSMGEENNCGLFDRTGYVDVKDLSSSNEVFGTSGVEAGGQGIQKARQTCHESLQANEIYRQPTNGTTCAVGNNGQVHQIGSTEHEKTVFASNMDFTESVDVHMLFPLRSNYQAESDKTLYVENMDLTEAVVRKTSSYGEVDDNMDVGCHKDQQKQQILGMSEPTQFNFTESCGYNLDRTAYTENMDITRPVNATNFGQHNQFDQHNKTAFADEMDITKPVDAAIFERQLNKTVFFDEMEITKPVDAAIVQRQAAQLNKTAFADEMDITKPVHAAIFERQVAQLNKTAFADEMDITKPVHAAIIERQVAQLNKTAFADEMEITKPISAAIIERQKSQLNKTVFADEMDITKPISAAIIECQVAQLNKTAFADEMDITKPVDAAIVQRQTAQLNKTAFADEMDITKPVHSAIFERQVAQLNKTAFADEMDITKPVHAAIFERQVAQLNKTAFADEMDITKPVHAAIFERQMAQLNKTVFADEMEITKPVHAAIFERQVAQLNKTAFADEMDITKPISAAIIERQVAQLNKTAFADEMDITKPVDAAIVQRQTAQLNETVFADDMDLTKAVHHQTVTSTANECDGETIPRNATACFGQVTRTKNIFDDLKQETQLGDNKNTCNSSKDLTYADAISSSEHSLLADFPEPISTKSELPANTLVPCTNEVSETTCASSLSQLRKVPVQSDVTEKFLDKVEMPGSGVYKTSLEETMDFTEVINQSITKTYTNTHATRRSAEAATPEDDVSLSRLHTENIAEVTQKNYEFAMDASEGSPHTADLYLSHGQMSASSEIPSPSTSINLKFLSQSLQDTLNKLRVLPIPEISSISKQETKASMAEIVSPKLSSEKCFTSLDSGLFDSVRCEGVDDVAVAGEKECGRLDNKVHLSEMKRPRQSETQVTNADLGSPPKQICLRSDDGERLAEPKYNLEKCETIGVSFYDNDVSFLIPEELDDSLGKSEAFIVCSPQKYVEEIAVTQCQENINNSHLDLANDEVQKCQPEKMVPEIAPIEQEPEKMVPEITQIEQEPEKMVTEIASIEKEPEKMVPEIAPIEQEPETIEGTIKKLGKSSKEWVILELEDSAWSFSFFCKTLDLVLQLGSIGRDGDREVTSINFISHRTEKSTELCHFSHKKLMNAFPAEKMLSSCKSASNAVPLLNSISKECTKIKLFVDDFLFLRNLYGLKLKNEQQIAHVEVTSYPLFSSFVLTINLARSWKKFAPGDIKVLHLVGKTILTEVIKSLSKGVEAGPHCLKKLFLDVIKYVENLEKFRPPGPLRFD